VSRTGRETEPAIRDTLASVVDFGLEPVEFGNRRIDSAIVKGNEPMHRFDPCSCDPLSILIDEVIGQPGRTRRGRRWRVVAVHVRPNPSDCCIGQRLVRDGVDRSRRSS
jgi:hypothetical protein